MPGRPNILFLLSDQHNPHIAGFSGNAHARTQHLDELAGASTVFSAAVCQSPLCVPSRISMLTGKYTDECSAWDNGALLDDEHVTFPRHLSAHGYTTCCVGKMHLAGPCWMGGFEYRPYGDLRVGSFPFHQPDPPETWDGRWSNHGVGRFPWAGETRIPESLLVDEVATREALAFLREHVDRSPEKAWLMTVGYSRPHFPLTAPGRYIRRALGDGIPLPPLPPGFPDALHPHDRFIVKDFSLESFSDEERSRALAAYYACVDYVDDCIGNLLRGLERDGLLENTYIVYTSDHGDLAGEHGLWWKRSYYEASAGVPLIIGGPELNDAHQCGMPVELVDLFPTFCDMAGVPIPEGLPGESLIPLCGGRPSQRRKQTARCDFLDGNPERAFRMVQTRQWKYVEMPEAPSILFDRGKDPGETTNVLASADACACQDALKPFREALGRGLDWDSAHLAREADRERWNRWWKEHPPTVSSPVQYRLADGRIEDADSFLYSRMEKNQ